VLRAVDRFQQRHTVLGFPVGVVKKFGDDQAGKHAALLAYYGFLSLFPLLLVFVTVLGYALANDQGLQERVTATIIAQFPVFGTQIQGIHTIQGSGVGLVVGIVGTLWGGLGITQSAQDAMNAVWNIRRKDRPNFWFRLHVPLRRLPAAQPPAAARLVPGPDRDVGAVAAAAARRPLGRWAGARCRRWACGSSTASWSGPTSSTACSRS